MLDKKNSSNKDTSKTDITQMLISKNFLEFSHSGTIEFHTRQSGKEDKYKPNRRYEWTELSSLCC